MAVGLIACGWRMCHISNLFNFHPWTISKENKERSRLVVFTQGELPVIVCKDGKVSEYSVPKLAKEELVDTNGAGKRRFVEFWLESCNWQSVYWLKTGITLPPPPSRRCVRGRLPGSLRNGRFSARLRGDCQIRGETHHWPLRMYLSGRSAFRHNGRSR